VVGFAGWQALRQRALFVRIGRMRFYDGPAPGDERPIDGGSFNRDDIGHEAWNFRLAGDRLYGYFQPPKGKVNLERIDPSAAGVGELSNVLVVMVA
jgi:hypothetical protein